MAVSVFTITELAQPGERFEWTADEQPVAGSTRGGARACPVKPWPMGGSQRIVRTDYPGARVPSFQILGPGDKPFNLSGKFDDRYNFAGYAEQEMARFYALARRGNMCRFQYGAQAYDGVIETWDFEYRKPSEIGYTFQVNPEKRTDSATIDRSQAPAAPSPAQVFDQADLVVQATTDVYDDNEGLLLDGDLAALVLQSLSPMAASRDAVGATLDARELAPQEKPTDAFLRLATQFRQLQADAYNVTLTLAIARSDVDCAVQTPMAVLNFEDWTRSIRFMARVAMGTAHRGDRLSAERSEPNATRLYRPHQGESLYAIARRFLGSPHAWRVLAERNALTSVTLTGQELLIIPERGA